MALSKIINKNLLIIVVSTILMGILIAYSEYVIYVPILLLLFLVVLLSKSQDHLFNLMILLLPIMVYLNLGITFNFSFSDVLLPISLFIIIPTFIKSKSTFLNQYRFLLIYLYLLVFALVLSLLKPMLLQINHFDLGTALSNIMKILINFSYLGIFLVYFIGKKKSDGKFIVFLRFWNITAVLFSILCISGVLLHFAGIETTFSSDFRATGTFEDPNLAASFLIISLGFCLVYNNIHSSKSKRIPFNLFFIIFALLLTSSRGGVLGLGLGFIFVILINLTNKGIKQIAKIVFFFFLMILLILSINYIYPLEFVSSSIERISNVSSDDSGTNLRLLLWKTAFTLWKENPILGVGFGQYLLHAHHINSDIVNIPHNTYLSFLAETGVVGFLSFFSLPIYLFFKLLRLIKRGDTVSIFLFVSFSGIMVQAFTINLENFRVLWVFYAFILHWVRHGSNLSIKRGNGKRGKTNEESFVYGNRG